MTPDGHYEFNRIPFGYVNAPAVYQRAIDRSLGPLKGKDAFVYMDDVLIPSSSIEEGFERLDRVLKALAIGGFSLNYNKCKFFSEECEYLGVIISQGQLKPSPKKVGALTESPSPTNIKGVRQLMGLASYFCRFIANFFILITNLLRKDSDFLWSEECEKTCQILIDR